MTLSEALCSARARLAAARDPEAPLNAEVLLCHAANIERATLYAWPERTLSEAQAYAFSDFVRRRLDGEPIAYILGRRGFYGLELEVAPGVLIPRPETELLVDWALDVLPSEAPLRCTDLGTGSGAIAIALAQARPAWHVVGVEREGAALEIAVRNRAQILGSDAQNLELRAGDWLAAFGARELDLVLSNPPYIPAGDAHLQRGDLRFEPAAALASGIDGLEAIRRIIAQAAEALRPDGLLLLEHGWHQGAEVRGIMSGAGWRDIVTRRDLAGLERATGARRPPR